MDKIKLEIIGIEYSQTQTGSYVLKMLEIGGKRRLNIVIGGFEAQAIAVELEKMVPNRPLTHDLFKTFCTSFEVDVMEVVIYKFHEGVFFSKIVCKSEEKLVEIDSRTSDAIAIGVRFNCPVYTLNKVMDEVSNVSENEMKFDDLDEEGEIESFDMHGNDPLSESSLEELQIQLNEALENEDYELASKIRDEISQRKK
jgi:hypothetical protein